MTLPAASVSRPRGRRSQKTASPGWWQPVVDGAVLPGRPVDRIVGGSARDVDVLVGTNTDDWRLWLLVSGAFGGITDEVLTGEVRTHGYQCLEAYGLEAQVALRAYR